MITLDGNNLSVNALVQAARNEEKVALSGDAEKAIAVSQERLKTIIAQAKPVYGLNTGFGIFSDRMISHEEGKQLNRNLILSHAVGTGDLLPEEVVRAAMLIRANTLSKGFSGIRLELVQTIIDMLNKGVTPLVASKGSLGSSGDLCMLAQMAMVMTASPDESGAELGQATINGELLDGRTAMQKAGIERITLENKEGLALINGATFCAALLALEVYDSAYSCFLADLAAALSFEALLCKTDALHPKLHQARGLQGQITSAALMAEMLRGSQFVDSYNQVQDGYSLRCAPQVHGAVRDTLKFTASIVSQEMNAATDNPLIVEDGVAVSGGNFHGEPIGMAADFLGIAISELAAISERRVFRHLDSHLNHGLPAMLVGDDEKAGLNSGIMMLQYTAASLVLENQTLSSPDSVRSLPTSANQEDFNANANNAALHTRQILENAAKVLVTEIYSACRAIDLRRKSMPNAKLGNVTGQAYQFIRDIMPFKPGDIYWKEEIEKLQDHLLKRHEFRDKFFKGDLTKI